MKENAIIALNKLLEASDYSKADFARALNISPQALDARINPRKTTNPKVETLSSMLGLLGYDVALVRKGKPLPEGSILIDGRETM